MGYIILPILSALVLATPILLIVYHARFKLLSAGFWIFGIGVFYYVAIYQSRVCTGELCGLGNAIYGSAISFGALIIALIFAIFPRKR
jgi:hypothetical protein